MRYPEPYRRIVSDRESRRVATRPGVLRVVVVGFAMVALGFASAAPSWANQVLLDKPVKAGELIVFPGVEDENTYYYISDKPHLAVDANDRPKFSLLRWVDNVRTDADEAEAREGEGGGILHALVALSVTDDQLREARRELRRIKPNSTIAGPVVFTSGRFALISSFNDPESGLTKRVVGIGAAPILDGEQAAVSILLTKQGAKILWESFQTPTPDVSFSFEMELKGYQSPKRALIEADFDQIYDHKAFNVALASSFLSGEIKGAFDDLQRSGAIKVTQVGEDAKMEELLTTAYNKLTEMMFQPLQGTGTPNLASLAGGAGGQPSLLDRATAQYNNNQQRTDRENARIRSENRAERQRASQEAERQRAEGRNSPTPPTPATPDQPSGGEGGGGGEGGEGSEGSEGPHVSAHDRQAGVQPPQQTSHDEVGAVSHDDATAREARTPQLQDEVSAPPFSIMAAFEMKQVRQRGKFKIDLNKYTADQITLRFDENIGDLRRFWGDGEHFREVNLASPLFDQREISVFLDGLNGGDFGDYVNFVTVQMRKTHAEGALTTDEVRIDRNNFTAAGNNFKMLYGWKNDNDRRRWLDYEYRTKWSFFGGHEVEQPWQSTVFGALNVASPFERRVVELEADPDLVADAGIRAITVELFYKMGDQELSRRITLNPRKERLSAQVEFIAPAGVYDYEYQVTWRLLGNRTVSSGRQSSREALLYVDELPAS